METLTKEQIQEAVEAMKNNQAYSGLTETEFIKEYWKWKSVTGATEQVRGINEKVRFWKYMLQFFPKWIKNNQKMLK